MRAHRLNRASPVRLHRILEICRLGSLGAAILLSNSSLFGAAGESEPPDSPPQFYNQGTKKYSEGKLREAEASLQTALASQNEKVQIPALYNLGHVRFREGLEELKGGPNGKASAAAA